MVINLEWQERGPLEDDGQRVWQRGRRVCLPSDYPEKLACHNPRCEGGGFEIGERIAELLTSRKFSDENSLICTNAIHEDRDKRCMHTIIYTITALSSDG